MTENELRVGNIFSYSKHNNIEQVYKIEFERMDGYAINGIPIDRIKPIPLTEEWLIKLGFADGVHEREVYFININDIATQLEITYSLGKWYPVLVQVPEMSNEDLQIISLNHIDYVHQLQNLYFAVCQSELEIAQPI